MQSKKFRDRLACVNWDTEIPMKFKRNGSYPIIRKVLTSGWAEYEFSFKSVEKYLRGGNEVRFVNHEGKPQLRLFPVVLADMKTVVIAAQVMKDSALRNCLNDKKVKLIRQKSDVKTLTEVRKLSDKVNEERRNMVCVTPDKLVQCPKCGTQFRIGKVLSEQKK